MSETRLLPFLTFSGCAEEAMGYYNSIFPDSHITQTVHYAKGDMGPEGKLISGVLEIGGLRVMFMDLDSSPDFSWATTLFYDCRSEAEFDSIFDGLANSGSVMMGPEPLNTTSVTMGKAAWVTDRYGVTWQLAWDLSFKGGN